LRFLNVKNKDKLAIALNNVWIGQCRIWARRYDRFVFDFLEGYGNGRKREEEGRVVARVKGEGVKNIRVVGKETDEGYVKNDGKEEVRERGNNGIPVKKVGEKIAVAVEDEGGRGPEVFVMKGEKFAAGVTTKRESTIRAKPELPGMAKHVDSKKDLKHKGHVQFIPRYTSLSEDRKWATSGMVATALVEDSILALQQKVGDASFNHVVVTPMGSDRVFLHCTGGEDIWHVFNDAIHFFGMLFGNIHMWSASDVTYERGARLRVYGVPVHAWNDSFFKLCVMNVGRFVRADKCTLDRARLEFACVLISTTQLEILNTSSDVLIDGSLYSIKMLEEWGCNLGEDAFLTEVEYDSRSEALLQSNNVNDIEEVQGEWELDNLVNDFHK